MSSNNLRRPDLAQRRAAGGSSEKFRVFIDKQKAAAPTRNGGVHRARILE
jgi:hypothetical protein